MGLRCARSMPGDESEGLGGRGREGPEVLEEEGRVSGWRREALFKGEAVREDMFEGCSNVKGRRGTVLGGFGGNDDMELALRWV